MNACSVIGTRQYRKMENDSTNILKNEELEDIVAAGETGERETNAPNQFEAPRAAEERETNVPCQRKTAGHGKPTCRRRRPPLWGETEAR